MPLHFFKLTLRNDTEKTVFVTPLFDPHQPDHRTFMRNLCFKESHKHPTKWVDGFEELEAESPPCPS